MTMAQKEGSNLAKNVRRDAEKNNILHRESFLDLEQAVRGMIWHEVFSQPRSRRFLQMRLTRKDF
jgi:hypothetical protein